MAGDEISLLAKDLVQLTVKNSLSIWKTRRKFEIQVVRQNLFQISFEDEDDLKTIMDGRLCGRVGHAVKDCIEIPNLGEEKLEEDFPYSLVLKVESNLVGVDTSEVKYKKDTTRNKMPIAIHHGKEILYKTKVDSRRMERVRKSCGFTDGFDVEV
ncbi:hypothetical protein Gorai_019893, partial [Gossypium raimondii]|nr:hypothetical protein [Gossypium raimondii]